MRSLRLQTLLVACLTLGCGSLYLPWLTDGGSFNVCSSDLECSANQVCYVDGCGDPGENLAVEVVPQQGVSEAQDFLIPPGNLRPQQVLDLFPPSTLGGTVYRWEASGALPYSGRVGLSVRGESALIPGLVRRYDTFSDPTTGMYRTQVGAGDFTVTARAEEDPTIPPVRLGGVLVSPGDVLDLPVFFPSEGELVHLSGRIVRTQADQDPVQAALELQVLDTETREALSQRIPVSATGDFSVSAAYPASLASSVLVQVTPKDPSAQVPRRLFTVPLTPEPLIEPLEFGAYGSPVPVRGRVLDSQGQPVAGASVSLEGQVTGGGTYRSQSSTTAADGTFQLQTLAGDPEVPMRLSILPPALSTSALTVLEAVVPYTGGDLKDFRCLDRVAVNGMIVRPDGVTPAGGVRVVATPVAPVEGFPLPSLGAETRSDAEGMITLSLDPALYRLELSPGENLPRVSRFVAVRPQTELQYVSLPLFVLSNGRTVNGRVTVRSEGTDGGQAQAAPNATVRFFRITPLEGKPSSLLLGETVADSDGAFQVVLPIR